MSRQDETHARIEDLRDSARRSGVDEHAVALFREIVWDHYASDGRDMPWRRTRDAYRVLVSEVMLQQTRVERVLGKYREFLDVFPDLATLADAPLEDVLRVWKGLGYNRRAVALHRAARVVRDEHGGEVPRDRRDLEALPGVGPATAAGVRAFAYGEPAVYLETNVRSAVLHCLFPDREGVTDREVRGVLERALGSLGGESPREWYYALMDLGRALKRARANPSRRSAHHRTQAPFEGSDRQMRGRALEALLAATTLPEDELLESMGVGRERGRRILEALQAEGFVAREGGAYRIA